VDFRDGKVTKRIFLIEKSYILEGKKLTKQIQFWQLGLRYEKAIFWLLEKNVIER